MDVRLSPEQHALRDSVAQVVDRLGPHAVGELADPERAAKLDAAVAASGWRELRTASDDGSPWASGVEVALVAEELARGLADAPFAGPLLAAELRRLAGAPAATTAEAVAFTSDLGTIAQLGEAFRPQAEASGRGDASAFAARRSATPPMAVPDGAGAATALALGSAAGDPLLVAVQLGDAPTAVDLTRPTASVAAATSIEPIGGRALTADDLTRWTALGLALTCADLVGAMRGAIQLACDYAGQRRQYGQPIGAFQAVQHLLADAAVAMEGSRSVALHAAWAVDALDPAAALDAAAIAKAYCTRAARTVCESAIQVHGGIGNTWECLAHVYLRRVLLAGDLFGGTGANLARVLDRRGIGGADGLR